MIFRVPDTLTENSSERYIVSIRLWSGGLSFGGYIPFEKDSFFYEEVKFDNLDFDLHAIKEIFFSNPVFTYAFKKNNVVSVNRQYTLVPENIFVEKEKDRILSFTFSLKDEKALHHPFKDMGVEILYGLNPDLYEFCSRTLIYPQFTHAIIPILSFWKRENVSSYPKQLFVALREKMMDIACFDKGNLTFVNSFHIDDQADAMYYILYTWNQLGMDQLNDRLMLYGNISLFNQLKEALQGYVQSTEWVRLTMEDGTDFQPNVPLDLIASYKNENYKG